MHCWIRPFLDDLLLAHPCVLKLGISAEAVGLGLAGGEGDLFEGAQGGIEGRVCAWGGSQCFSLHQPIVFGLVLGHPVLVVLAGRRGMRGYVVGTVVAGPWDDAAQ